MAAMDLLTTLAVEKDEASKAAKDTGLTPKAFAAYWTLRDESRLKEAKLEALTVAKELEKLLQRFPNADVNPDELRQLRAALYRPLLAVSSKDRTELVEMIMSSVKR
jgi:type I restriction enzyme R subunit